MIGFVIGNGRGREGFDLFKLKGKGFIIGCNALYRHPNPADAIVCVDSSMAQELTTGYSGLSILQKVVPRANVKGQMLQHRPKFASNARTSGGLATDYAIAKGCNPIFWIGFDNPANANFKDASIYAGSKNYTRSSKWGYKAFTSEYQNILKKYTDIEFINVIRPGISNPMTGPNELGGFSNYSTTTYEEFEKVLERYPGSSAE